MDSELDNFEKLKASGDLPSPKGVALTIVRLAQREDVTGGELVQAIKADPAFVGRLLKTANIAARDSGRPVVAIQDAVKVLGVNVVRNLALGFSLVSGYRTGACPNFDYGFFWSRAIVNALAVQAIIRRTRWANADEAFCCGLLADIGRLALATVHSADYSRLLGELAASGLVGDEFDQALLEREAERFLLDHDELTGLMLADWGFPHALIDPIVCRQRPGAANFAPDSRGERLLGAFRLADAIVGVCLASVEGRPAALARLDACATSLAFEPDALPNLVDSVVHDWHDWAPLLSIASPPALPSFEQMLAAAENKVAPVDDASPRSLRVLLALPATPALAALQRLFADEGQQVFVANDGEAALERALDVQPQLLIADRHLPGVDGLQLTRLLRNTRLGRATHILILSPAADEDSLGEVFDAGADDYLLMPLNERAVLARFHAAARVLGLQEEIRRDHDELKRYAAELAVSNRRLHEASVTDPLTGFHNRRYAMQKLDHEWAVSSRSGRPLSCMMIDLDDFKQINDRHGHDVGDRTLVAIAGVLKAALRSSDVICRVGGDEFLVISPETDAAAARACMQRLLKAVAALAIPAEKGPIRCALSIGVATRSEATTSTQMLVKEADGNMYQAKIAGRGGPAGSAD